MLHHTPTTLDDPVPAVCIQYSHLLEGPKIDKLVDQFYSTM